MKVNQLARLLDSLVHGLDGVVNAATANEIASFARAMQPFSTASVGEFTAFLARFGAEFQQTGKITAQGKISVNKTSTSRGQNGQEQVSAAVAAIKDLFAEIDLGTVTDSRVDQVLKPYEKLTVPQLHGLLAGLEIAEKPRGKAKILEKIRQVVGHQMESRAKAFSVGSAPPSYAAVGAGS